MRHLLLTALLSVPLLASATNLAAKENREAKPLATNPAAHRGELTGLSKSQHSQLRISDTAANNSLAESLNKVSRTDASAEPENFALMLAGLGAMGLMMSRRHRD